MKTLVIGAGGQIGAYTVQDLAKFYKTDVVAADRKLENLKKAMAAVIRDDVQMVELDANDPGAVTKLTKKEQVETVINCAWYQTNLAVMEGCLKAGVHYVDLGGLFDTTLKQISHHDEWKKAGLNATIGFGSTPGLTNVAAAAASAQLDTVETIDIYCSWGNTLPVKEPGWPGYSIRTALDEFSQEPVMWIDGKYAKQPTFSGEKTVTMQKPVGEVTAYYVKHSEPATLGNCIGKGCRNVTFRIGFPSTDLAMLKTLTSLGFASQDQIQIGTSRISPLDFLTAMYQKAVEKSRNVSPHEEYEYDALKIDVIGKRERMPSTVTYNIITWNDPETGIPSTRDTSVPPSIAAHWQATGKIKENGVLPPEATIDPQPFFAEIAKRKIRVETKSSAET